MLDHRWICLVKGTYLLQLDDGSLSIERHQSLPQDKAKTCVCCLSNRLHVGYRLFLLISIQKLFYKFKRFHRLSRTLYKEVYSQVMDIWIECQGTSPAAGKGDSHIHSGGAFHRKHNVSFWLSQLPILLPFSPPPPLTTPFRPHLQLLCMMPVPF